MADLSVANGKVISTDYLYDCLKQVGICKGDIVCVHSHLMSFGKPLLERQEFMRCIIDVLIDTVGRNGTLIMPTFTYSFCENKLYDVEDSISQVGILTEYYRKCKNVKRTWHPIFSFAIGGNRQEEYLDIGPDAFSLDSVYGKMIRDGGKIVMLGGNCGYTFYYLAEEHFNVAHRYFKIFAGTIKTSGRKYLTSVPYFVRNLDIKSDVDEKKLETFLLESGCQKQVDFAKGTIAVIDCKDMYANICDALRVDEKRFL